MPGYRCTELISLCWAPGLLLRCSLSLLPLQTHGAVYEMLKCHLFIFYESVYRKCSSVDAMVASLRAIMGADAEQSTRSGLKVLRVIFHRIACYCFEGAFFVFVFKQTSHRVIFFKNRKN